MPSAKKMGGIGASIDVPLGHKDAAFVRSHFDAIEVRVPDAPRADEIVVAVAVTDSGRPLPRVGGLTVDQIEGKDGLRQSERTGEEGRRHGDSGRGRSAQSKLVIKNIGTLLSGALEQPILDADTIVAVDGRISRGRQGQGHRRRAGGRGGRRQGHDRGARPDRQPRPSGVRRLDAAPEPAGLDRQLPSWRRHHDDLGRRGPSARPAQGRGRRQGARDHRPARVPRASARAGSLHAGAPVLEKGMVEEDFKELAAAGVKLLGEVGLGGVKQGEEAKRMVAWARKYGIQSTIHTGGPSIPGSGLIDADVVLEADADVIGHINGGHTALPVAQIRCLCEQCTRAIEVVHNGNALAALYATRTAIELANRSGSSSAPICPPARACSRSASCGRSRC